MTWTDIPTGKTNAAFCRLMSAFGDQAEVAVERLAADPVFTQRMADYGIKGGIEPSVNQDEARKIMGKNFFGVQEAMKHFGVNPTRAQLAALSEIPFSTEMLTRCKDTHVLIAVFPLTLLEIRAKVSKNKAKVFYGQDWYDKLPFAKTSTLGWQLVRKTPVENSTSKPWDEQQALLCKDEATPTVHVVVYTMVGHFLNTGERLFENIWVRTSDVDSGGDRVGVGFFDAGGLEVNCYWDDNRYDNLGLASSARTE
jgi:hypothetical protein